MIYAFLACSILFALANNLLLHKLSDKGLASLGDVLWFNGLCSSVWIAVLIPLGIAGGGLELSPEVVLWGVAYGVVIASFLLSKMQAMSSGPVSLTSFIGCSSLLISTGFGVFVLRESTTFLQGIGVILLLLALLLIVAPKSEQSKPLWKLWSAIFLVFGAATGIIFKLFGRSSVSASIDEMLLTAAIVSAAVFFVTAVTISKKRGGRAPKLPSGTFLFLAGCGISGCLYNRLNIMLAAELPSVVFFPTFNGSVILLSTLAGVLLFKEKLKRGQAIGMVFGVAALMLASGTIDGIIDNI